MPFPWARYWRRVGVIFIVALVLSLIAMIFFSHGHVEPIVVLTALVDSIVLAVIVAFPLTQRIPRS